MASGSITLTELTKINDKTLSGGIADELLEDAPLIRSMVARPSSYSDQHKWLVYDDAPTVGFRALNAGRAHEHGTATAVNRALKILDASYTVDVAAGQNHEDGTEALLDLEGRRHLRAAFAKLERQIIYGTTTDGDSAGALGMANQWGALSNAMVFDGGAAGTRTSVWLIRTVDPLVDAAVVLGNSGNIDMSPAVMQRILGSNSQPLGVWFTNVTGWAGFQYGSNFCASRIANINATAAVGSPVVTDNLLAQAISAHPNDRKPNLIAMNRDALRQLRESRTGITSNTTGAPTPFPEEAFNIPIVVTDQISSAETAVV